MQQTNDVVVLFILFLFSFCLALPYIQLQLSPSRPAAISMMENRNGIVDDIDDEMELTEFYNGAGSQSVDCEASPPSLQVISIPFCSIKRIIWINFFFPPISERGFQIKFLHRTG